MKITDDYNAKIRLWAQNPQVVPAGRPPKLPKFSKQTFRSHEEMNRWKERLLKELAASPIDNG
jgi:hypothetical protein